METLSRPSGQKEMPAQERSPAGPIARRTGTRWLAWSALAEFGVGFVAIALIAAQDRTCPGRSWPPSGSGSNARGPAWYLSGWADGFAVACVGIALVVVPALVGVRLRDPGRGARAIVAVVLAAELAVAAGLLAGPAFVRWRYADSYCVRYYDFVRMLWWFCLAVAAVSAASVAWVAGFVARTTAKPQHAPPLHRSLTDWET